MSVTTVAMRAKRPLATLRSRQATNMGGSSGLGRAWVLMTSCTVSTVSRFRGRAIVRGNALPDPKDGRELHLSYDARAARDA
ncbi:hypothetical protein GCM10009725_02840 [Aeromicrobium tamlense]